MTVLRMARPMRRTGSRNEQFRQWIPEDVRAAARGRSFVVEIGGRKYEKRIGPTAETVTLSLRTPNAAEAKRRHAEVLHQFHTFCEGLRGLQQPIRLTHEECVRLAGDVFRGWTGKEPDLGLQDDSLERALSPEQMETLWRTAAEKFAKMREGGGGVPKALREHSKASFRRMVEARLLGKGMAVDAGSLDMVCDYAAKALVHGFEVQAKKAAGDLRIAAEGERYGEPLLEPQSKKLNKPSAKEKNGRLRFADLIEMWREAIEPAQSTLASYSTVFEKLAQVIGHNDARRLTEEEVQQYKQARLSQEKPRKVSPQTVKGIDMPAIRSVMQWAIDEGHVTGPNPAANIKVRVPRKALRAGKPRRNEPDAGTGFTDAEAQAILRVATNYTPKSRREKAKTTAAKRWLPWLLAYSGVRIGEMAQLRKEDVRRRPEKGFWYVAVELEAGTTKTADSWTIPLHSHLVELGFIKFVQSSRQGHLFFDPRPEGQADPDKPVLQLRPGYEDRWADKRKLKRKRKHARTDDPERGILGPLQGVKNRVAELVRTVVKEKGVDPNHGWRHRFKPWAIAEAGLAERMVDEIQHHSGSNSDASKVSRGYGQFTLVQKHEAVEKLPRYDL